MLLETLILCCTFLFMFCIITISLLLSSQSPLKHYAAAATNAVATHMLPLPQTIRCRHYQCRSKIMLRVSLLPPSKHSVPLWLPIDVVPAPLLANTSIAGTAPTTAHAVLCHCCCCCHHAAVNL